ncbi:MAG: rhodanese-like domain-containing protein [Chromatiales bacterium]
MATVVRVNPQEAYEVLASDATAVLVDVRSRVEFDYVGHPIGAIHVPWREYPDWSVNPDFEGEVRRALEGRGATPVEQTALLLICRSGNRSFAAGEELLKHGFTRVYNVEEGFEGDRDVDNHRSTANGWRFRGLPWEQT